MGDSKRHLSALKNGHILHWYEIQNIIGQGGFGITYLAYDRNLAHEVAIKEYLPVDLAIRTKTGAVSPVSEQHQDRYYWGLERFIEEARTLGQFKHPNIVRVRNVFEANNTAYMVMEYEMGESLQEILNNRKTLSEEDLKSVIFPIIDGMKIVHAAGFIHRDIKPGNIFIRFDGEPVLLDFGSARQSVELDNQSLTSVFSRGYAPIEQYHSSEEAQGPWTDIYALGATMYRAVAGVPPADAVDRSAALAQINRDTYVSIAEIGVGRYSEDLMNAIDYAMQFKQQARPQTISDWLATFDRRDASRRTSNENLTVDLSELTRDAENGDPVAQFNLAFIYAKGINTEKDEARAIEWFTKAAMKNHLNAQYNLALMYAKGRGVEQNFQEAIKWYVLAAQQGDVTSHFTLAVMYSRGIGAKQDYSKAFEWYLKCAEQGHANAQYKTAEYYARGKGVEANAGKACEWYLQASHSGHTLAQMKLAYMYGKGLGVSRNDAEAFHWFRKAAEQGHPKAQYNLGVIYGKGRGIEKNPEESRKWFELAAAQGDQDAKHALARFIDN